MAPQFHRQNSRPVAPVVSIVLLDWSCRERFDTLRWLNQQQVPRESYELIWVELYDRVVPQALNQADVVLTCGQRGRYHKHAGYNAGLLAARGQIITVSDSDAVFPPTIVRSVIDSFHLSGTTAPQPLVLMHYQWRTRALYPPHLERIEELAQFQWVKLWPNVGACMSVRATDAIRFGGFDEDASYRGYFCGPYDLGWRLVNAGIPERWHDPAVALWHFAHPDPIASFGQRFSWKRWREVTHPHLDGHALTAVTRFASGQVLPLQEHPEIHQRRLALRQIGTPYEEQYATWPALSRTTRFRLRSRNIWEPIRRSYWDARAAVTRKWLARLLGADRYARWRHWIEVRRKT